MALIDPLPQPDFLMLIKYQVKHKGQTNHKADGYLLACSG